MHGVSDAYTAAAKSPSQRNRVTGTVSAKDGRTMAFSTSDVLSGSLSVTSQCSEGDEVKIGGVYVGELDVTLMMDFPAGFMRGARIELFVGLELASGDWEDVPMGSFAVSSANRGAAGVDIVAYDNMSLLDKKVSGLQIKGKAFDMLALAVSTCGAELKNSKEDIEAMPNGEAELSAYPGNDIETWRDAVSWIAQALACFAVAARDGTIELRSYGREPVDSLASEHRWEGASFSEFSTRYTGVSVVETEEQKTRYHHVDPDDGLVYNLGSNPFLQYGTESMKEGRLAAILQAMREADYVPFSAKSMASAAYDVGDCVEFTGGYAGKRSLGCIMKIVWTMDGASMQGFGSDPALASAKSKADKDLSGLISQNKADEVFFYRFVNASSYHVGDRAIPVLELAAATIKDALVEFEASILLESTASAPHVPDALASGGGGTEPHPQPAPLALTEVTATYRHNGSLLSDHVPVETYLDGRHVLVLYRTFDLSGQTDNEIDLYLSASGGAADIEPGGIVAVLSGKGLAASRSEWNGRIEIEQGFSPWAFGSSFAHRAFSDPCSAAAKMPEKPGFAEAVGRFAFSTGLSPSAGYSDVGTVGYDSQQVSTARAWAYSYDEKSVDISDGFRATKPATVTTDAMGTDASVFGVSSMASKGSDDVLFAFSSDGGATWMRVSGGAWVPAADDRDGSTAAELEAVDDFGDALSDGYRVRVFLPSPSSYLYSLTIDYERTRP